MQLYDCVVGPAHKQAEEIQQKCSFHSVQLSVAADTLPLCRTEKSLYFYHAQKELESDIFSNEQAETSYMF